ncbi:hypothetical protein RJ639_012824 [Escallonia herrerae]|uniref:Pectate lyase n=1 Tax=Escallonia herrerae TaxID=1293975 RepID=A0AA88VQX0_9ASTE|nr:hypothetical protein RJ639_012824 [Escallonia herrerae]
MSTFYVVSIVILLHAASHLLHAPSYIYQKQLDGESSMKNSTGQTGTGSCRTGNPIDDCWRCDPDWETNRKVLADCGVGFGRNAVGGRDGEFYVVKDSGNDDPENHVLGTLRYAVIQEEPLWIIFNQDMVIQLKEELIMNSYKTIDGRGFNIEISKGPCIAIQNVSNIIIHGIYIHDCVPAEMPWTDHAGLRGVSDGDGISLFGARDIWIDHLYGSTAITISNNYMFHHNEVMLMGHRDDFLADKKMQVTIAFNYFGEGLVQRIPRCRLGYFHIVNNIYTGWKAYAVGGSANPTINSQGNVFIASDNRAKKEVMSHLLNMLLHVTKHVTSSGDDEWKNWNWRSDGDLMMNGAYFTTSGQATPGIYAKAPSMVARPASLLQNIMPSPGVLSCKIGQKC